MFLATRFLHKQTTNIFSVPIDVDVRMETVLLGAIFPIESENSIFKNII